ncbi:17979_t:CDS:2, partial [Gigaspora margarita]
LKIDRLQIGYQYFWITTNKSNLAVFVGVRYKSARSFGYSAKRSLMTSRDEVHILGQDFE